MVEENYNMKKIIFVLSVLLLFYSILNILNWFNDSNSIAKESEKIINTIVTNNNIEIAEVPETVQTTNSSVDYSPLEQLNSDVVRVDKSRWHRYRLSFCANNRQFVLP